MRIELSRDEVEALRTLLQERLVELDREINRTDAFKYKARLQRLDRTIERFVAYVGTKRVLAAELVNHLGPDASLFTECRGSLFTAGEPLLQRAQEAGVVRPDVTIAEVIQMVVGIAKIPTGDRRQTERLVRIALDGLRYRPDA